MTSKIKINKRGSQKDKTHSTAPVNNSFINSTGTQCQPTNDFFEYDCLLCAAVVHVYILIQESQFLSDYDLLSRTACSWGS